MRVLILRLVFFSSRSNSLDCSVVGGASSSNVNPYVVAQRDEEGQDGGGGGGQDDSPRDKEVRKRWATLLELGNRQC